MSELQQPGGISIEQSTHSAMYLDDEAVLNVIMIRQRETLKLRSCWLLPLPRFVNPY